MTSDDETLVSELAPAFELLRPLGEGAVARVHLAREEELQRLVAIKVLHPVIARDPIARQRFLREARSAARIVHPNVVGVYRVGALSDGRPYLVMEYVEGRDLGSLLEAEGPRTVVEGRQILAQLARGLEAAHDHRVVHRDVRPGNVLRERGGGRVVLTDFGIAGVLETDAQSVSRLTMAGQILGQPRYAAPEQLQGAPVTEAADLYSLAVTGYEVLTLRGPYEGDDNAALIQGHLEGRPIPLERLRPDVDGTTARLLERCLSKRPEHRPSAGEVVRVLEGVRDRPSAGGVYPVAGPYPTPGNGRWGLGRFIRELRQRGVSGVAILYLTAIGVLLGPDLILEGLPVSERFVSVIVWVALAGFPVALVLAWMFDVREGSLRRAADPSAPILDRARLRLFQALGIALSVAVVGLLAWWILG